MLERMKLRLKHERYIVLFVFLVGFFLRLVSGINSPLTHNECGYIAVARTISFDPTRLNLPIGDDRIDHPLLSLYVFKISSILFGETKIGFRMMNIIIGSISLLLIYALTKQFLGKWKAILAMLLLCLNQFHIGWSRALFKDIIVIFWTILAVLLFLRALRFKSPNLLLVLGLILGVGYLIKEVFPILLVVFFAYLITSKEHRLWLKTKQFYLMILIMFMIIYPRLYWSFAHFDFAKSDIQRDLQLIELSGSFSFGPMSFYFSPFFHKFIDGISEFPVMDILSGLICVSGVIFSFRMWRDPFIGFMLILFCLLFAIFTFLANPESEYWWVAMTLIPSSILASNMLVELKMRYSKVNYIIMGIIVFLFLSACSFVIAVEEFYYSKTILPPKQTQVDEAKIWQKNAFSQFLKAYPELGNLIPQQYRNECP